MLEQKYPEQLKDDPAVNNLRAESTTGDISAMSEAAKSVSASAPPDVRNRDAVMNESRPYVASEKAGGVGAQYANMGMNRELSAPAAPAAQAASDAYRDVKASGGTDVQARAAAVAGRARPRPERAPRRGRART